MNACGQTMFMISCRTNSEAAEVLMLNPAKVSSSAMVAVPPDDDALVEAPLVPGDTATTDTLNAPAARAAKADRLSNPLSPIALPIFISRPGDGRYPQLPALRMPEHKVNVTQSPHWP